MKKQKIKICKKQMKILDKKKNKQIKIIGIFNNKNFSRIIIINFKNRISKKK